MHKLVDIVAGLGFPMLLTIAAAVVFVDLFIRRGRRRSPPGPPALPLIGHINVMPKELSWEKYHEWCKGFDSDIIELNVLGTSVVVLDSIQAANELLEKRSSIYSSRPRMPMVTEMMGWDFNLGTMPYGPRWRAHRRIFEKSFHIGGSSLYEPQNLKASRNLLLNLLREPDRFMDHFRYMAGSVILSVAYGIETKAKNDPFIKLSEDGIQPVLEAVVPGTYLVDTFPILKYMPDWMPLTGFKRIAKETRLLSEAMITLPYEVTKKAMLCGGYYPSSFVSDRLQELDSSNMGDEELIKNTAATMYSSGSDNLIATLTGFVLAVLAYPEAQSKAQYEIDSVLSKGAIPTFEDKDSLPYVTALTMEVFRWTISSPLGGPHLLEKDDEYKGYTLRAGSIIFANVWAILHDETLYPEPFKFKPERFIKNGKLDSINEIFAAFGFGRRICPGKYMAFSTIWIAVASILAAFHISKAVDSEGNVIEPQSKYSNSSSCIPTAFKCLITPRNPDVEKRLLAATAR